MNNEEAIENLKNFNDGYTFQQCQTCFKFNEKDGCCNKEKCEELQTIDTVLNYIEELEEENKELKEDSCCLTTCLRKDKEKLFLEQKIRDKIEELKENNNGDDYNLTNVIMILKELLEEIKNE